MSTLSRRDLLAAAGVVMSASAIACKRDENQQDTQSLTLECARLTKELGGRQVKLRAFNGTVPGPMIRSRPGQLLRITLKNSLPSYDSTGWTGNHNVPHALGPPTCTCTGWRSPRTCSSRWARPTRRADDRDRAGRVIRTTLSIPGRRSRRALLVSSAPSRLDRGAGGDGMAGPVDRLRRDRPGSGDQGGARHPAGHPGHRPVPQRDEPALDLRAEAERHLADLRRRVTIQSGPRAGRHRPDAGERIYHRRYPLRLLLLNGKPFFKETHNPDPSKAHHPVPSCVQRFTGAAGRGGALPDAERQLRQPDADRGRGPRRPSAAALDAVNYPEVRIIPLPTGDQGAGPAALAPANRAEFLVEALATAGRSPSADWRRTGRVPLPCSKVIAGDRRQGRQGHAAADQAAGAGALFPGRRQSTNQGTSATCCFSGTFPGRELVIGRYRLHHQQQLVQMKLTCRRSWLLNGAEIWNLEVFSHTISETKGIPPHPRQSLRASDADRQQGSGDADVRDPPRTLVDNLGAGEKRGDDSHALQAMDREVRLPLPRPSARGYRDDAELPHHVDLSRHARQPDATCVRSAGGSACGCGQRRRPAFSAACRETDPKSTALRLWTPRTNSLLVAFERLVGRVRQ